MLAGFVYLLSLVVKVEMTNCSAVLNRNNEKASLTLQCPPWFTPANDGTKCQPGPSLGGIIQQDLSTLQTKLPRCYCMTEEDGVLTLGVCMYTCNRIAGYYALPCHVSQLQNSTCSYFKRRGHLCSQCIKGHALPVYSYEVKCVKCEQYHYNWLKYLAAAYLPITLLYILVTLFSLSFTTPTLSAVVMVCQIVANPIQLQVINSNIEDGHVLPRFFTPLRTAMSIAGLWNLDFFRIYYSFCLHPSASIMHIMALDFATTIYPV